MLDGYAFGTTDTKLTPYDYMCPKDSEIRKAADAPPLGFSKTVLTWGIPIYAVLPPIAIWERGVWFDTLPEKSQDYFKIWGGEKRCAYVVSGEGTPGNYLYRVYVVPTDVAAYATPPHPKDWDDDLRDYTPGGQSVVNRTGSGWTYDKPTSPPPPKAPPAPKLPVNIRFRCTDCGHWFKEDDLPKHKMHTCPGKDSTRESDWALMCECCHKLDEVAACKLGFPRPKPVKQEKEVKETDKKKETPVTA